MKKIDPSSLIQLLPDQLPLIEPRPEIPNLVPIWGDNDDNLLPGTFNDDWIFGLGGNDTLNGFEGDDILGGGTGNDFLSGDAGIDTMVGDSGDDRYFVEDETDSVFEEVNNGVDVVSTLVSFDLVNAGDVENLRTLDQLSHNNLSLLGNALDNEVTGNFGNNTLSGRDGNDILIGLNGDDILNGERGNDDLNGGEGQDEMRGGSGSDSYYVDNDRDRVFETTSANPEDVDFVFIEGSITFLSLEGQDIEAIYILPGVQGDIAIRGSETSQLIVGNEGNNLIMGLGGDDQLAGSLDPDNSSGNDTLIGGDGRDELYGDGGDDSLVGGNDADLLNGGGGFDIISGGAGRDIFVFSQDSGNSNAVVMDFLVKDDQIHLYSESFPGLSQGNLDSKAFFAGTQAGTADHRIIYDRDLGRVYYDEDGAGGAGQVVIFNLSTRPKDLSAADFVIL